MGITIDNMHNQLTIKGTYNFEHRNKEGVLLDSWVSENIVTTVGKAQLALLSNSVATPFTYLAVGSSATAVTAADTTLTAEIVGSGLSRAVASASRITTTTTNDTMQLAYTWTATATVTVNEVGVFNASSAGFMLSHALTGAKTLNSTDTLQSTYTLTFA